MPTLPLDPQIQGSAARLEKARTALTKKFDPDQPRDKNGRWVSLGHLVVTPSGVEGRVTGVSGPSHVSVDYLKPGDKYATAHGHKPSDLKVLDTSDNRKKDEEAGVVRDKGVVGAVLDSATTEITGASLRAKFSTAELMGARREAEEHGQAVLEIDGYEEYVSLTQIERALAG